MSELHLGDTVQCALAGWMRFHSHTTIGATTTHGQIKALHFSEGSPRLQGCWCISHITTYMHLWETFCHANVHYPYVVPMHLNCCLYCPNLTSERILCVESGLVLMSCVRP